MKVGELARTAGVTAETVRHYTREGLLRPQRDPGNGYQLFDQASLNRLRFIQRARTLGFSLKEIGEILDHADHGDSPCPMVRDLLATRLPEIRQRIVELERLAARMESALNNWSEMPDGAPDGHTICRLIEHWNAPREGERHD
ncbi:MULTISPECIES: MerR family transcriptional regulator [Modicisalibacter]|uniref:MerR family transcriptional regulator n=1 Tax=Modicisalibacter TaxID=574347 RepID=UPI00100BF6CF|nr:MULTISPECIES: MerR family transcriptional regulator [Halomonadaceae]MBZ9558198.1 MerR family DNA-binding protein [Modicisalibacter sp. R2A 31.J]MBZ9573134.1 MerR family DNA-binding protein [Modicisalibacter sp. MOD 31.J]